MKNLGTFFISYALAKNLGPVHRRPLFYEERRKVMGSSSRIGVFLADGSDFRAPVNGAFQEMMNLEAILSIFRKESEISILNRKRRATLSIKCLDILERSLYFSKISKGAFDVTGGYFKNLHINDNHVGLDQEEMCVDLGAIGIGYGVDRALESLRQWGVKRAIVDGGGEIGTIGGKPDGFAWRVGIRNPFDRESFIDIINLEDGSVSTSGNYEKRHIRDPRTGRLPDGLISATVIARDATTADALSTAAFVLGAEEGIELIDALKGIEGLLISLDRQIIRSRGFHRFTDS